MRNVLLLLCLSLTGISISHADEEIQLAAAIGMPTTTQTGGDDTIGSARRSDGSSARDAGTGSGPGLSTMTMVGIGVGVAVVIGAVSGGSSSTTSH